MLKYNVLDISAPSKSNSQ